MSDGTAGAAFAELLRELKDRSGHSYGTLSRRLHMSASTLHRYCNGDAVPTDYGPVERFARLCKASPGELVDLHRRWVLADADRGRTGAKASGDDANAAAAAAFAEAPRETPRGAARGPAEGSESPAEPVPVPEAAESAPGSPVLLPGGRPAASAGRRGIRGPVLAGIAVAAVASVVALTATLPSRGDDSRDRSAGAASATVGARRGTDGRTASASPSHASPSVSVAASASATDRATNTAKASPGGTAGTTPSATGADTSTGVPLTVHTRPYSWEDQCSQHYLVDAPPDQVAPPPVENDAPAWVAAEGAVSAAEQYVTLTVQGAGADTVVLDSLTVRTTGRRAPLPWTDYTMGVGCGGGVSTRSFSIDLDAARPALVPKDGQHGFPIKVSESDPMVFYVRADASAYDTSWYLELNWSSGSRHGTVRIDDQGRPFRTSGSGGRPAYWYLLGGDSWTKADTP
ncbi:helix-turn-helix domain-containing protein [Streptomyces sp. NPDC091217]|uniref:helix-turn-helix domain-containing protein n=2 Tax=unclassified Streptomyces TaxID=2593676 RepID=UPI0037F518CA